MEDQKFNPELSKTIQHAENTKEESLKELHAQLEESGKDQLERKKPTTIKEFREVIDRCMNSVKYIRSSREVSLCFTHLQRAFMWIGESQKFTGSQSPYVLSQDPSSPVIEPTHDHIPENNLSDAWVTLTTHTARVKDFRSILSFLVTDFRNYLKFTESPHPEWKDCMNESFLAMKESKMWLGWELARIKKEIEGTPDTRPTTSLPL